MKRRARWLLLLFAAANCSCRGEPFHLEASRTDLLANGVATRELRAVGNRGRVRFELAEGRELVETVQQGPDRLVLRAGLEPGRVRVKATDGGASAELSLRIHLDPADSDSDGFPDVAELRTADERALFRSRFVACARSELLEADPRWEESQRDCAGLVRFAYREALRKMPSRSWERMAGRRPFDSWGRLRFAFPRIPFLGEKPFRILPGEFRPGGEEAFSSFADAEHLLVHNVDFISSSERAAQPGDLLFFLHPQNRDQPYHVMIYFREAGEGWLVYHTGSTAGGAGRLKQIPLSRLEQHPDPSWHPRPNNESFLGFYRFKILG